MRRALVVVFAIAAGAAAAALALLPGGEDETTVPQLAGRPAVAAAAIEPRAHLFGDVVSARVDVVADRALVDPATLRLRAGFEPYEPVGPATVERRDVGGLARLRFSVPLRCLGSSCVPPTARRVFAFPAAEVVADERVVARVDWPEVEATSRVTQSGLVDSEAIIQVHWRANMTELPRVSYRLSPALAVWGLAGLAGLLVAGAAVLLVVALRPTPRQPPVLPPLARALALLEAACRDGDTEEQRRALDLVAAELHRTGEPELAEDASTLAWARPIPPPEQTATLSGRVAVLVEQGRNGHGGSGGA